MVLFDKIRMGIMVCIHQESVGNVAFDSRRPMEFVVCICAIGMDIVVW